MKLCIISGSKLCGKKTEDWYHNKFMSLLEKEKIKNFNPSNADVIVITSLGVENGFFDQEIIKSNFYKKYKEKIVVYSADDIKFPAIPGIYTSCNKNHAEIGWSLGGHYISSHRKEQKFIPNFQLKDITCLFMGSTRTAGIRKKLYNIYKNSSKVLVIDSDSDFHSGYWWESDRASSFEDRYNKLLARTRFALCPCGFSPSTIRLFESLQAGCVPIIISDNLVLPFGPNWEDFSIRIKEKDIEDIPSIVDMFNGNYLEMAKKGRASWEEFFSDERSIYSIYNWALKINSGLTKKKRRRCELNMIIESWTRYCWLKLRFKEVISKCAVNFR